MHILAREPSYNMKNSQKSSHIKSSSKEGRAKVKHFANCDHNNAARERNRVRTLRNAFAQLQQTLPSIPPDTKLSKLDILILATAYIGQLSKSLQNGEASQWIDDLGTCSSRIRERKKLHRALLHPVKKWPMRSAFYWDMSTKNNRSREMTRESYSKVASLRHGHERQSYEGCSYQQDSEMYDVTRVSTLNPPKSAESSIYSSQQSFLNTSGTVRTDDFDWLEQFSNAPIEYNEGGILNSHLQRACEETRIDEKQTVFTNI